MERLKSGFSRRPFSIISSAPLKSLPLILPYDTTYVNKEYNLHKIDMTLMPFQLNGLHDLHAFSKLFGE